MADPRYTVLGQAAAYQESISRSAGGGPRKPFRELRDAQASLLPQLLRVVRSASELPPHQRLDQVLLELRLDKRNLAKSYHPKALLDEADLRLRGAGVWTQTIRGTSEDDDEEDPQSQVATDETQVASRSIYVSATDQNLARLRTIIAEPRTKELRNDVIGIQQIRLPTDQDRLGSGPAAPTDRRAIEIVLYAWDAPRREEAVQRITAIIRQDSAMDSEVLVKNYQNGPTFIAAIITPAILSALAHLNFLRLARPLPRVALTRTAAGISAEAPPMPVKLAPVPTACIAVFDGGTTIMPQLKPYVRTFDETTRPALLEIIDHGTSVVSAAVYGHIVPNAALPSPSCSVFSFRVLPDPRNSDLELYGVVDALERIVPRLPASIKVVNLSFGPIGPIDTLPSRFTYAIDRLSFENDKLFITAVGNDGHKPGLERIQSPSDSVNNVAVGAFTLDPKTGAKVPAPYSCGGPGRPGCARKPDVVAFGGSSSVPFYVLDRNGLTISGTDGTSYAAPIVASVCANILARVEGGISTQACRALLLHAANSMDGDASRVGWGASAESAADVLACTPTRVSVLYEGLLTPRSSWKLPFLVPSDFDGGGNVQFSWTIVYCPDVDHSSHGEYTLAGIELQMRPHSRRFFFNRKNPATGKDERSKKAYNLDEEKDVVAQLVEAGWRPSPLPATANNRRRTELSLRSSAAKWDTVVRDSIGKQAESIKDSMLTISIIGRGEWDHEDIDLKARFGAVLTVNAPKYKGDLYAQTLRAWTRLRPLNLRAEAENRLRV
jgi:hypothetical protein